MGGHPDFLGAKMDIAVAMQMGTYWEAAGFADAKAFAPPVGPGAAGLQRVGVTF